MRLGIKFFYLFFFSGSFIWGQVKIGDNVEVLNPAAVLELEATDKGLLLRCISCRLRFGKLME